jgi:hypothetical protein
MKRVATALNEQQTKQLKRKLEEVNMTEYTFLKKLILNALEPTPTNRQQIKILLKEAVKEAITILDNAP